MEADSDEERARLTGLVPDYVHELHTEYLYRHHVIPGLAHEDYLDEPGDVLEWMTRIHAAEQRAAEKRQERAQARVG